jgi:hypothetical protein
MPQLLAELTREQTRASRAVLDLDRFDDQPDSEAVEDAVKSALGLYDNLRALWNRVCDFLDQGLSPERAKGCFRDMAGLFEDWLDLAAAIKALVQRMPAHFAVPSLQPFHDACRRAQAALEEARNGLDLANLPPPEVSPKALEEARGLFASGKFKSTKGILESRGRGRSE